jgi:hypothetical protein
MTPKTIGQLIEHHEKQVLLFTTLAAVAEDQGETEAASTHLAFVELHQKWADELREFGTSLVDNLDALSRPLLSRPVFLQPLNPSAPRHA